MTDERLRSNIWKFYAVKACSGAAFFVPVIVLFWQQNGLSMTQIMLLQTLFSIAVVLLEVPTGYLADRIGRKQTLAYAGLFMFVSVVIYGLGDGFAMFLVAELLWAVGISLQSGTDAAIVYDTLKGLGEEHAYKRIWGHAMFLYLLSDAVANIAGGFLGVTNYRWTFFAMAPLLFLTIPLSASMEEPKHYKRVVKKGYLHDLLTIIKETVIRQPRVRWIIIYASVVAAFNGAVLWLYQPYLQLSGIQIAYFGVVFASFQLVAALSSQYAHKVEAALGKQFSLAMLIVLVGGSYLLMSNFIWLFSFSFAFLQQFVRGFSKVVVSDYLNEMTTSDIRATILSVESLGERLVYALIIPFVGLMADAYTLVQTLTVVGVTVLVLCVPLLLVLRKTHVI